MNAGLRVAVVGGGIGGLFTAIALREAGLQASVYEQAPALGEIGAGVFLTPNTAVSDLRKFLQYQWLRLLSRIRLTL